VPILINNDVIDNRANAIVPNDAVDVLVMNDNDADMQETLRIVESVEFNERERSAE